MKLSILVDNNTLIDRYFLGEPGFSAFIEDGRKSVLFDVGYSSAFMDNAAKMGIDISRTDFIAVSHGHLDHSWGFDPLIRFYAERSFEGRPVKAPTVIAHPEAFTGINMEGIGEIGSLIPVEKLNKFFDVQLTREPRWITDKIVFLGQIPRKHAFEGRTAIGIKDGSDSPDYMEDDSALVYRGDDGLVVITGCSHSGICNIVDYAIEVCGDDRIQDVVGGLHLLNPSPEQLNGTLEYLKSRNIGLMHPCHCTDLKSKIALAGVVEIEETGSGLRLEYR